MDDLIKRLKDGVVEHDKRWSGDTHDDLGGSANYDATEAIMAEAAAALAEAQAEIGALETDLTSYMEAANEYMRGEDRLRATLALVAKLDESSSRDQVWAAIHAARAALEAKHG